MVYRNNKIFAIGIDAYDDKPLGQLDNSRKDAWRLVRILKNRYNFVDATDHLFDEHATKDNIDDALYRIADDSEEEDILIIFFAGHGGLDEVAKGGFWNPIDGQDNRRRQRLYWNSAVVQAIEAMKFKHILLISDSCFSGTFITRMRAVDFPPNGEQADLLVSRWIFASGGEELVKDGRPGEGSPFMNSIVKFLETTRKRRFPATDLFRAVEAEAEGVWSHTPKWAPLAILAHQGGILLLTPNDSNLDEENDERISKFPEPTGPVLAHYIPRSLSPRSDNSEGMGFFGMETARKRLAEIMDYEHRIVLLGNAGSGKSRELQKLRTDLLKDHSRFIPIYKRFNTYIDQQLGDFLPDGWRDVDPYMAVFILDGLDEVQPQYFGNAVRSIEEFVANFPQSKMVISCRMNFYEMPNKNFSGTLGSFAVYELNDISLGEIREYSEKVKGLDGEKFITQIFERRFNDLVQKPFFLEILLEYFGRHNTLDAPRSAIIDETLTAQMAANREHMRATAVGRRLTVEVAFQMLEEIAFIMEQMGKNALTDREVRTIFPENDAYEMVQALPSFYRDEVQDRWQFEHNNIQEFLAARTLDRQNFDEILRLITTPFEKTKPSWTNTLSFFVSIREDDAKVRLLLDWLVTHDPEVIFRFEAERIPEGIRIGVALQLIQYHAMENIWFSSTRYSEEDIARIGAYPEVVDHLLNDLESADSSRVVVWNAFRVLRHIDWGKFPGRKARFKTKLLDFAMKKRWSEDFSYSVLNTIGDMHLITREELADIIYLHKNSINAYIRAGLYSLIISYGLVDEYIEVFIEGLHPESIQEPTDTRSDILLLDEQVRLHFGLTKVKSPNSVVRLMAIYNKPGSWRHFSRDETNAFLENIVNRAVEHFAVHDELLDVMFRSLKELALHGSDHEYKMVTAFFVRTGTEFIALENIIKSNESDYVRAIVTSVLVNVDMVPAILTAYRDGNFSEEQIRRMHSDISWNTGRSASGNDVADELATAFAQVSGVQLEKPVLRRWEDIQQDSVQSSFDLLFDRQRFKEGIEALYKDVGGTSITWADVVKLRSVDRGARMPNAIFSFFSNFFRGQERYPLQNLLSYVDSPAFDWYAIRQAYQFLIDKGDRSIAINEQERADIIVWCETMAGRLNLENEIFNGSDVIRVLWYFIQHFRINLPTAQLLSFALYYDLREKVDLKDTGTIDVLLGMLDPALVNKKVMANLVDRKLETLSWLNNASYAICARLVEAYPIILERLVNSSAIEYKYEELLSLWFEKSGNVETLREVLIRALNLSLKMAAGKMLSKIPGERQLVAAELAKILDQEETTEDERLTAAGQMMAIDDVRGLAYITGRVKQNIDRLGNADITFGYSIAGMTSLDAMPYLLELTSIALRVDVRPRDRHGFFFSKVLDGIYNVGLQSRRSLDEVTRLVNRFIKENEGLLTELEVLKVNLRRMEEQFSAKENMSATLEDAIQVYAAVRKI